MSNASVAKAKQVSTTIPADYFEALENYRWDPAVKLTMTQLVRVALDEYAAAHGIMISGYGSPAKA